MDFLLRIKFYPVWVDLIANELTFKGEDLTFCDDLFYGFQFFKVVVDFEIGFDACEYTLYDNMLGNDSGNYCDKEWTYMHDLKRWAFTEKQFWLLEGCTRGPEQPEPETPEDIFFLRKF